MQLHDQFESIKAARDAITRFVLDKGESFHVEKSDKKRFLILCKERCGFRILASKSSVGVVSITVFKPHTCSPRVHYNNPRAHGVSYLIEHHRASIINNQNITAAQIRSDERLRFSNTISYRQAYRTIQAVLTEMYGDEAESFAKFPAYAERFQAADPDNYCKIKKHKETGNFQAAFFAPVGLRHAHMSMRSFIGIDGTHTGSRFRMTLLIAGGIDANGETLPLAWALVPIECSSWWSWFMKHLKQAFNLLKAKGFIIMSDREKGLPGVLDEVLPDAVQGYCCQHIADNVQTKFGITYRPLFWTCARAKTKAEFDLAFKAIWDLSVNAATYINTIPHKFWTRYCFPEPRAGVDTNNIIESINSAWADIRRLPPLQMMDAIYTLLMKTVHDRYRRPQRTTTIADAPLTKFNDRLKSSKRYQVFESGNGIYQVQIPNSGRKVIVNLKKRYCDCGNFQEYLSPCAHAIVACRYEAEDPYDYMDWIYSVEAYRKTYSRFLLPVNIDNLPSEDGVLPPVYQKQRGRPPTKRIRKGAWKRKATHCSNCHGTDHNIRKCRHAPALNGRQQRARDRESSISSESSRSDDEELNLQESDLDSDDLQDLQFQAEMEQYDAIMENAHVIAEKERQRQEKERDLESESMEGIETSGAELGDIEMGGTGASLTDQDVQDDAQDG
jgi:cytochrome c553